VDNPQVSYPTLHEKLKEKREQIIINIVLVYFLIPNLKGIDHFSFYFLKSIVESDFFNSVL